MPQNPQIRKTRIFTFIFMVLVLASIRIFEESLFYDPYLDYFKSDFNNLPLPIVNKFSFFASLFFRYLLNSMVSIVFIQFAFKDYEFTKFAMVLYGFLFIILTLIFYFTLAFYAEENKMILFYIRRFLIQPIFLLLFIPGFFIQKKTN